MRLFQRLSFQSKLLVLILAMVIFIGGTMGLLIRTAVFPYLVREVELRGSTPPGGSPKMRAPPSFSRIGFD